MKRSKRLQSILDLIMTREEEASQKLGQARQRQAKAEQSMNSLTSFLASYTEKFNASGGQGMGIRQLMEYRAFLSKINAAIEEQAKIVARSEAEIVRLKQLWEQAHRKTLGVKKVMDKSLAEENRIAEKTLQAEMDEWASRRAGGSESSDQAD